MSEFIKDDESVDSLIQEFHESVATTDGERSAFHAGYLLAMTRAMELTIENSPQDGTTPGAAFLAMLQETALRMREWQ